MGAGQTKQKSFENKYEQKAESLTLKDLLKDNQNISGDFIGEEFKQTNDLESDLKVEDRADQIYRKLNRL